MRCESPARTRAYLISVRFPPSSTYPITGILRSAGRKFGYPPCLNASDTILKVTSGINDSTWMVKVAVSPLLAPENAALADRVLGNEDCWACIGACEIRRPSEIRRAQQEIRRLEECFFTRSLRWL